MVSDRLLSIICCPDCRHRLDRVAEGLTCPGCQRRFAADAPGYLDLRPIRSFTETTKYTDAALHADARQQRISPPLLSAGVRNHLLRTMLRPAPGDRIVDLGCGSGRMALWNRDLGAWTMGVDVSPFFAGAARDTLDLVLGDLRQLPFPDRTFTKGYSLDVLEHLSPGALREMLSEAGRVLEPGGQLFLYSHVRKNSPLALGLRGINACARGLERMGLIDMTHERLRKSDHLNPLADIPELRSVVTGAGFRVERLVFYTPLIGGFVENILVRVAERAMTRRAARRLAARGAGTGRAGMDGRHGVAVDHDVAAVREARGHAQRRLAEGGPLLRVLQAVTWIMRLDLTLFGHVESGPFFALLTKEGR
jgi:ubiquinone/menaquinone biosynthesis C-methylase UbiE